MRAFAIDEFGARGSIHEVPIPEPGDGEVLVAVHAAGVNVMDPLYFSGAMRDYMEHRFPLVPGIDVAGVVERTGSGVDGFAAGDEVYGVSSKPFVGAGSFAEYVVAGAENMAPKPQSLGFVEAAVVPHVGLTALAAIEASDPQPGEAEPVLQPLGVRFKGAQRLPPARLPELTALIDGGQLRVPPIEQFTLDAADEALNVMASGHVRGKLVIRVR